MFEVGFTELLVISVLALIVLGPEKLPKVVSDVGRWMGRARAMARQFREQLEDEVTFDDPPKSGGSGENAGSGTKQSASSTEATAAGAAAAATGEAAVSAETSTAGAAATAPGDDPETRHNDYPGALYSGADDHYAHAPIDDASPVVAAEHGDEQQQQQQQEQRHEQRRA